MTFNREKIVFLAPLNWDFLSLPRLAWANFLIFQLCHMNDDLGKILSMKSSEIKSYTANKQKRINFDPKICQFLGPKGPLTIKK